MFNASVFHKAWAFYFRDNRAATEYLFETVDSVWTGASLEWGWPEELGVFNLEEAEGRSHLAGLIPDGGSKEIRAGLFPVVPRDGIRDDGLKLEHRKPAQCFIFFSWASPSMELFKTWLYVVLATRCSWSGLEQVFWTRPSPDGLYVAVKQIVCLSSDGVWRKFIITIRLFFRAMLSFLLWTNRQKSEKTVPIVSSVVGAIQL